jgi:hypothetical protein
MALSHGAAGQRDGTQNDESQEPSSAPPAGLKINERTFFMIRKSVTTLAVFALAIACAAPAEAGGRRPKTTTTRTIVNATNRTLFATVFSGTAPFPTTVGQAQAAKAGQTIAPGGKAVFNVLPNAGGNQFGDMVQVIAAPPLVVTGSSSIFGGNYGQGNYEVADYPGLKQGQTLTITVTSGTLNDLPVLIFTPPAP